MATLGFEQLDIYKLSERLADLVWETACNWSNVAKDTIGKQMIRSADSVGANIAEGAGRGTFNENRRFVRIARGSLYETHHFLRRAFHRNLLDQHFVDKVKVILDELRPRLNAYLRSIGPAKKAKDRRPMTNDK